jgi:hypothetical protein
MATNTWRSFTDGFKQRCIADRQASGLPVRSAAPTAVQRMHSPAQSMQDLHAIVHELKDKEPRPRFAERTTMVQSLIPSRVSLRRNRYLTPGLLPESFGGTPECPSVWRRRAVGNRAAGLRGEREG